MYGDYSKERLKENIDTVLVMEYLGIHIEDVKNINDEYGIPSKTVYYFSVPEISTIEVEDKEFNEKIKDCDGLIHLAKEELLDMLMNCCKDIYGDDYEFIEEVKNNSSDYFKFYAKVRTGEKWTKEMGENAVKTITDAFKTAKQYKEV